ncbi:hypothetical protein Q3O60_12670 [Alkalimonas collagenimarina]|uniref:Uncharacterized protein n=1 Tax=Alkalimonas collagenimarina TaxID=400390 RepID=A0ABT9H172_9GAMM|nr:hypothetical protein [Alkalimonas collagenimarina]MDP4537047.1 hypothetical protein [Alkalimonas collagenimarina]
MSDDQHTAPSKVVYPGDELRTPVNVLAPDQRNFYFGATSIEVLYQQIEQCSLSPRVPDYIIIQFDTARNLFLHALYVYRFYVVAESQVLAALELAIRECIGDKVLTAFQKELKSNGVHFSKGLRLYLEYLARHKLMQNEDFPIWHRRNRIAAEEAYRDKIFKLMEEQGLEEYQLDESEIDESAFDEEWDYVQILCETLPKIRNIHSHGSTMLHNQVLLSFVNISIIINKMFERTAVEKQ